MAAARHLLRLARQAEPAAPDGALLARYAAARDEAAFAELVRRTGPVVRRACRAVLGDDAAADDAFQATYLVLARKASALAGSEVLAGWLHATAVRVARDARRAEARRRRREAAHGPPARAADDLTWREVWEVLDAELAALPEAYRTALVLCYLQELGYEDAAARAGCSVGALRGRLERGKEALRRRLARRGLPLLAPALVAGRLEPAAAALVDATLAAVGALRAGGRIPAAVAELARPRGGIRAAVLPVAVGLVAVGALLAGAGPGADPPPAPRPADAPGPRTDLFGDPLPDGAVLRLGTTRSRADIAGFGIAADGSIVTTSAAGEVGTWSLTGDRPASAGRLPVRASDDFDPGAAVSPDGRYLAANTRGGKLVVWERGAAGFREVASFPVPRTRFLRFSPDGTRLAAVGHGVRLCDIPGRELHGLSAGEVEAVAFSGDGTRLAVTTGTEAELWDARSGRRLARFNTGRVRYLGVALNRAGTVMAVCPAWGAETVVFVAPTTGEPVPGLAGPPIFPCLWASVAPDDKTVLLGDRSGVVLWDPAAGKVIRRFEGMAHGLNGGRNLPPAFSPDGKVLVGTSTRALLRWDAGTGAALRPDVQDGGHQSVVWAVGVSPDGRWVGTRGLDSAVRVWDTRTGRSVGAVPSVWWGPPGVEFAPDGGSVYAPSPEGGVTRWEIAAGRVAARLEPPPGAPPHGTIMAYRVSPDERTLGAVREPSSSGSPGLWVRWDTGSGKVLTAEPAGTGIRAFPELSPDGRWVATTRSVYPLAVGPAGNRLPEAAYSPYYVSTFSADGRLIARPVFERDATGAILRADVYELATGTKVGGVPLGGTGRLAFHPDGRSVAVVGPSRLTFVDLRTTREYARRNVASEPRAVRFFPDGMRLVTGHEDTTALVWQTPARPKADRPLDEAGRVAAWDALIGEDGAKGWAAIWALADDPGAAGFLRTKLRPVEPLPAAEFTRLLADLGAADFATREAAERALRDAGERAAGQLRAALAVVPSAEQRARLGRLAGALPGPDARPTGERLRAIRAVAALELAGSADARRLLAELAAGAADAALTREAAAALARLTGRPG